MKVCKVVRGAGVFVGALASTALVAPGAVACGALHMVGAIGGKKVRKSLAVAKSFSLACTVAPVVVVMFIDDTFIYIP